MDRVSNRPLRRSIALAALRCSTVCVLAVTPAPFASAQTEGAPAAFERTSPGTLRADNPFGRRFDITLPLFIHGRYVGDIAGRIDVDGAVYFEVSDLNRLAGPILRDDMQQTLIVIGGEDGRASLEDLAAAGFDVGFDQPKFEAHFRPTPEQVYESSVSLARGRRAARENSGGPTTVSAYINAYSSLDYSNLTSPGDPARGEFRVGLDGAARFFDFITLEAEGNFEEETGVSREGTRLVYDDLDTATRWRLGDTDLLTAGFLGGDAILGLEVERRYGELAPDRVTRPSGRGRFRINRPSEIDVIVNGVVVRRLTLQPGIYDLEDFSLTQGANDVTLRIEDVDGRVETLEFTLFFDRQLLATDVQEFGFSLGVASTPDGTDISYDFEEPRASGYYRTGITDEFTLGVNGQASDDVAVVGAEGVFATLIGTVVLDAAVSSPVDGTGGAGFALNFDYQVSGFRFWDDDPENRSFSFSAEYVSPHFERVGGTVSDDYEIEFDVAYRQTIGYDLSLGLSGSYDIGRDGSADRYAVGATSSYQFTDELTLTASGGHEDSPDQGTSGVFFTLGLNYSFGEYGNAAASYDSQEDAARVGYAGVYDPGFGPVDYNLEAQRDNQGSGFSGGVGYTGPRAEVSLSHTSNLAEDGGAIQSDRTTARVGTAIVFADGHFALSRPVTGGFLIVDTHPSLDGRDVRVDPLRAGGGAESGLFGPAVVHDLGAHSTYVLPYEVDDLPPGYDLGAGAFTLTPGYRAGAAYTVGSDYSASVVSTLYDRNGNPVPLVSGVARHQSDPSAPPITVFTNRTGRFVAQGMKPGLWIAEVGSERYEIFIPDDAIGLVRIEELRPIR